MNAVVLEPRESINGVDNKDLFRFNCDDLHTNGHVKNSSDRTATKLHS